MAKFIQSPSPENGAGWLSIFYSWWIFPLVRLGGRREVELEEIYTVMPVDSTVYQGTRLSQAWEQELKSKSPSLHRAIFRTFGLRFSFLMLACTISNCLSLVASVALGWLLLFFEGEYTLIDGYCFAVLLILLNYLTVALFQFSKFWCQRMGMNIRVAVSSLLYEKALLLRQQSLAVSGAGRAVNLLSNDMNRYDWSLLFLPYIVSAPVQLILLTALICVYVGPSFLTGVGLLVLLIPFQGFIGTAYGKLRASIAKMSDRRLSLLTELINGMQLVKMACWEEPFRALLSKMRQDELRWIRYKWMLQGLNAGLFEGCGKLVIFLSLLEYAFAGNLLTPEKVFVGFSLYKNTMLSITEILPTAISRAAELHVSTKRIQEFLLLKEKSISKGNVEANQSSYKGIKVEGVSVSWVEGDDQQKTLDNINICLGMGDLLLVNGQVGAGKSSLLQVLMEELEPENGLVSVEGRVAYSSQDAWVFPGNVKENILFGTDFDENWYNEVVAACALKRDIELLPYRDLTLVGDRGVTLSGGQRARLSLARAIYSKADIYLLDDPLSAVDAAVAKHLVDKCLTGILKTKCVLIVTHQLNCFPPESRVLVLDNGRATSTGKIEELQSTIDTSLDDTTVDALVSDDNDMDGIDRSGDHMLPRKDTVYGTFGEPIVEQEVRSTGAVTWRLYAKYLASGNSLFAILLLIFCMVGGHALFYYTDYFLTILSEPTPETGTANNTNSVLDAESKLETYAWLTGAVFLASIIKAQIFFQVCLSSASAIYKSAFETVLRAPMRFFDENSNGRILNRFSSDTGTMDEAVPTAFYWAFYIILDLVATLVIVVMMSPLLLVLVVVFIPFFVYIQDMFLSSTSRVKRLEGIARSPVFAHFASTLEGLSTIRCFGAQKYFTGKFLTSQDVHSSAWFAYLSIQNWCAMTGATLTTFFFAIIVLSFMLSPGGYTASSHAGLAISLALSLSYNYCTGIQFIADSTNQMVAVERVMDYSRILPEALHKRPGRRLARSWPERGQVLIHNLVVKYGEAPPVIRGISLCIKPSEKVGIVGRTGAGKSSLIAALFRLIEPAAGEVHIDGLNLHELGLHEVRSAISFIPQNPVIFSGTIRKNLDPFDSYDDTEMWSALVKVQLEDRLLAEGASSGLDSIVSDCGGNFSQGERQLICLARSLLSKRKVVVLDEATANIDPRTEHIIQETIRKHFEGCTVIVIAHRLETVIELDQIFFMDAGMVIESGEPISLLDKQDGKFRELVMRTGPQKAEKLLSLARKAHLKRMSR